MKLPSRRQGRKPEGMCTVDMGTAMPQIHEEMATPPPGVRLRETAKPSSYLWVDNDSVDENVHYNPRSPHCPEYCSSYRD